MLESKVRMKGTGSKVRMTDSKALMIVFLQEISSVFLCAAGLYRWYCLRRVGWYILESPVKTLLPPLAPPPLLLSSVLFHLLLSYVSESSISLSLVRFWQFLLLAVLFVASCCELSAYWKTTK